MHHVEDAAAGNEVDVGAIVVPIPDILDVTWNGGIHSDEVLKLIHHQGEVIAFAEPHYLFEELCDGLCLSEDVQAQGFLCFGLELSCENALVVLRDVQV